MTNTKDLVATIADLSEQGYTHEFRIKNKQLFSDKLNQGFGMEAFSIDETYTFSTDEDGSDQEHLFAITLANENIKGFLVDASAAIATVEASEVQEKFDVNNAHIHLLSDAETRYGLPRIHKATFNSAPERYIFRIGFPDFPACPFGNTFEALGWDVQDKNYVWLVSSVIKDDRLVREQYKN